MILGELIPRLGGYGLRFGNVSGWYARLNRECPDRIEQIDIWLSNWESSLARSMPIAAIIPENWPTLSASLLTDLSHVLDQLLCRTEAEQLLSKAVRHGDALRGEWPWQVQPSLLISHPPWLRIKDRFRGHENGISGREITCHNLESILG